MSTNTSISDVNKLWPKLYKYGNSNKVIQWHISLDQVSQGYNMITVYGEQDGKQMTTAKLVSAGKASRTKLEQAILETTSKWTNKKEKEMYCEELQEKNSTVRPMLAQTYKPQSTGRGYKMPLKCFVQPKLDGLRCLAYIRGGAVRLESRKGIEFHNLAHIKSKLSGGTFFEKYPDVYLDGELYTKELGFEEICGYCRHKDTNANANANANLSKIQYHIYDFYLPSQPDLTFTQRTAMIAELCIETPVTRSSPTIIHRVHTAHIESKADVLRLHGEYIIEGYEGIMLRDPVGIYEPDKRSRYLQKYKEFLEEEFEIVGYHDGEGQEKGLVVWDCVTPNQQTIDAESPRMYMGAAPGRRFSVRPRGTHDQRRELFYEAEGYIGKTITVIFQEYTADGVPRFPVGKAIRDIY